MRYRPVMGFLIWVVGAATLLFVGVACAQHPESYYATRWCESMRGKTEVVLADGTRADCITETHAVEVERAAKFYGGIGQSLWYAFQTNKRAGLVMIVGPGDGRYMHRLESVVKHYSLPIDIWRVNK